MKPITKAKIMKKKRSNLEKSLVGTINPTGDWGELFMGKSKKRKRR